MPLDRDTLIELALRCEQATGADREIDRDIGLLFDLYDRPEDLGCFHDLAEAVVGGGGQTFAPPAYTGSLDAAMTLVPKGWSVLLFIASKFKSTRCELAGDGESVSAEEAIEVIALAPALALCAAGLRAIAATLDSKE